MVLNKHINRVEKVLEDENFILYIGWFQSKTIGNLNYMKTRMMNWLEIGKPLDLKIYL